MNNVMIDLETLSTRSDAVIIQLAAVKFEFKSDNHETFCMNIDPISSKKYGMSIEQSTVQWWKEKSPDVIKSVFSDQHSIETVLDAFNRFIGPDSRDMIFWCQGASFDFPVLQWSYTATNRQSPWKYWNQRCSRTVYGICDLDWKNYPRVGNFHNGLDDCLTQIRALKECLA